MRPDCAIARTAAAAHEGHVLVAGARTEGRSLYLAANGCDVTTLDPTEDVIERVIDAAAGVGLTGRIRGVVSDLAAWEPDFPISAVVCAAAALQELVAGAAAEGALDSPGGHQGRRRPRGGDELGRREAGSAGGARGFLLWMADHGGGVARATRRSSHGRRSRSVLTRLSVRGTCHFVSNWCLRFGGRKRLNRYLSNDVSFGAAVPQGMDGALQVGGPRPLRGLFSICTRKAAMRKAVESKEESEPVGIVISRGEPGRADACVLRVRLGSGTGRRREVDARERAARRLIRRATFE